MPALCGGGNGHESNENKILVATRITETNDELIPEVAAQSGAMIVTHNTKDFAGLGVAVRTPAEFLKILREGQ